MAEGDGTFWDVAFFVAFAFDGPGLALGFGLDVALMFEWPDGIRGVGVFEDFLGLFDQVGALFGEVLGFGEVFGEVVDFNVGLGIGFDGLPVLPASGLFTAVTFMEFPVEVVAFGSFATFEEFEQGETVGLVSFRWFDSGHFGEGRHQVPEGPWFVGDASGGYRTGPPSEGGLAKGAFIHATFEAAQLAVHGLIEELPNVAFGAEGRAVVAAKDDEGVFIDTELLEGRYEFGDIGVDAGDLGCIGFLYIGPRLVGVNAEVVDLVTAVRQGDGVEHEEGVFAVFFEPADHVALDDFLSVGFADVTAVVARKSDGLLVAVEIGGEVGVGMALAVVAEEVVHALFLGSAFGVEETHAPLAKGGGVVAGGFGDFANGDDFIADGILSLGIPFEIAADGAVARVEAGVEDRATGSADTSPGVSLIEERALIGEAIESGGLDQLLAIDAHVALSDVIRKDKDEVGFIRSVAEERGG